MVKWKSFSEETEMKSKKLQLKSKLEIGIDEVGRGPIAGPVAVGAFVILDDSAKKIFKKVKESKQLSERQREEWFAVIQEQKKIGAVDFAVTFQSEKIIDSKGLSFAIRNALKKSLDKVSVNLLRSRKNNFKNKQEFLANSVQILLDGGLKAPSDYENQKTIVKGDEKIMVIALASICAKVLRDRYMVKLAKYYPRYGLSENKGYGTKNHYKAIGKYGVTDIHRKSWLK